MTFDFPSFLDETRSGGGGISPLEPAVLEPTALSRFLAVGADGGGGGISEDETAVLPEVTPSVFASSLPSEAGGDANRAVGRVPEVEGPLPFFRIGCGGAGRDDDGVGGFVFTFGEVSRWASFFDGFGG